MLTRVNPTAPAGQFSEVTTTTSNSFLMLGHAGSNLNYTLQASTNLGTPDWINIGTIPTDELGQFMFNATNASAFPQRYFRLIWP